MKPLPERRTAQAPTRFSKLAAVRCRAIGCFLLAFVTMSTGRVLAAEFASIGADRAGTTIEAEDMRVTGTILGPEYGPNRLETESSGQKCVQLRRAGESVEFTAPAAFDSLVVRFNLPDAPAGGGLKSEVNLRLNGQVIRTLPLSSRNAWLYGNYPFSNDPAQGKPRNFYDELRVKQLKIAAGDVVCLEKTTDDGVPCTVDLVDLELMPAPATAPARALSALDFGADPTGRADATGALRRCIAAAHEHGNAVWVPEGDFLITGDLVVPSDVTIQGAGMWRTTFIGDATLYADPARRVRFKMVGRNVHFADFAIVGQLNYRNDQEPNDGVVVAGCTDASVTRVWVEHTKAGIWVYNGTNLVIDGCRFRNLLADGVNFCVGTNHSVIQNCWARGTGDDCFAIWPVASDQGHDEHAEKPGNNVIRRSTGQLPFLANGASLYGGANNRVEDCLFTDITAGCGVLISSTFPTSDEARRIDNNFSGTTVVRNCMLLRCGGYDHDWAWRGAFQICMDRRSISGLEISHVDIRDSFSDGLTVVGPGSAKGEGTLTHACLEDVVISNFGLGVPSRHGLWIRQDAVGDLTLSETKISDMQNDSSRFSVHSDGPH